MTIDKILIDVYDNDTKILKKAYESDVETCKLMYKLFSKLLVKLVEKQILSEEDMIEIMKEEKENE